MDAVTAVWIYFGVCGLFGAFLVIMSTINEKNDRAYRSQAKK